MARAARPGRGRLTVSAISTTQGLSSSVAAAAAGAPGYARGGGHDRAARPAHSSSCDRGAWGVGAQAAHEAGAMGGDALSRDRFSLDRAPGAECWAAGVPAAADTARGGLRMRNAAGACLAGSIAGRGDPGDRGRARPHSADPPARPPPRPAPAPRCVARQGWRNCAPLPRTGSTPLPARLWLNPHRSRRHDARQPPRAPSPPEGACGAAAQPHPRQGSGRGGGRARGAPSASAPLIPGPPPAAGRPA
jgi:hypothetical protein